MSSFCSFASGFALFGLLLASACGGSTISDFPGNGGGGTTGSGTGNSGAGNSGGSGGTGGDPCNCGGDEYAPVCGTDGQTYNANCGTECVPVPIACDGECPCVNEMCADLEEQYIEALRQAKQCAPLLPVVQCTIEVNNELACPCPTMVEQANSTAIAKLQSLQNQWDMLGCGVGYPCPEILCADPMSGNCVQDPNGNTGSCQDVL